MSLSTVHTSFTKDAYFRSPDGSILLLCGNTGFRVHAGLLAQHTSVFTVTTTGHNASTEDFDGCPIFGLNAAARDIRELLTLLYKRRFGQFKGALPLTVIARVLPLAVSYRLHAVWEELIEHLQFYFPRGLEDLRLQRLQGYEDEE
ncbi:hypothetical protein FA95DRAFT_1602782 [Auriscalpium vulgare]|uniref:Uncharacterized protein n=1 Tax=Auriscalpium vulgare TaxID=40419 RepID=A0ACB8S558_9AGAM|nr:hypothetical protein FA95DRAFT_1602782 [Auriscalpium vulgare]